VWGLINEADNIIYLKEVFYEKGLLVDDIAYKLDEGGIQKTFDIVADSSEPRMLEELKKRGYKKIIPTKKEAGSVLFGINLMKQYKIQIDETSTNLIEEFKNYRWGKDRSGNITSKPTGKDHLVDSSRYLISQMAYKPKPKYSFV
jgi:phage terminase large subunit